MEDYPADFQYSLDYLSGAQAQIYIGSVLLDEVTTLQWTEHQSKIPLYGYASQYFDEVARGAVLVQGQFSINFIQPNYLFSVLKAIKKKNESTLIEERQQVINDKLRDVLKEHGDKDPGSNNDSSLWTSIHEIENRKNSKVLFKAINDAIWGPTVVEKAQTKSGRADSVYYNGFDIKIKFELEGDGRAQCEQVIKNVHILGSSKALVIDEQPIQEVYSFYARKVK